MTNEELQKIAQSLQPLFRFLAKTHQDEAWHDTRRQFLAQADQQIVALVDKPEKPDKKPDKPKPGRPSNN